MSKKMSMKEAGRLGGVRTKQVWLERYAANPKQCKFCGQNLSHAKRHNKFCDHSCAASFTNKGVVRNFVDGTRRNKTCLNCGKNTSNQSYCSRNCCFAYRWNKKRDNITFGGELPKIESGYGYNPHVAKRYLSETRGRCCEICGGKEWMGKPIPLVLDHISGDPDDHKINNLRLVCGNCNMLLPTFAGRNLGKGRKWRKEVFGA